MAPDFSFDDPQLTQYSVGTRFTTTEYDSFDDVNRGLQILRVCANFFFVARKEKTIDFGVGVTESMLEMMGVLLTRAAHCSREERTAMFLRWEVDGPLQCSALIEKVAERDIKILAPDDFAMFLKCPRGY
jgi:hypothetical protein